MQNKIYSMIGLCMKAGKLSYGSDMCEEKIKYKKVRLLIIAKNASDNTKERFKKLCKNDIAFFEYGTIDEISHVIGKDNKAVIGVLDEGFGKKIYELFDESLKGAND